MGPTTLFGLGAGEGGLSAFCDHFADTFNGWWADLGSPELNDANAKLLEEGLVEANEGRTVAELSQRRDAMLVAIQRALAEIDPNSTGTEPRGAATAGGSSGLSNPRPW